MFAFWKTASKTSSIAFFKKENKPFSWLYFELKIRGKPCHSNGNLLEGIPNSCRGLCRQNQHSYDKLLKYLTYKVHLKFS